MIRAQHGEDHDTQSALNVPSGRREGGSRGEGGVRERERERAMRGREGRKEGRVAGGAGTMREDNEREQRGMAIGMCPFGD